MLVSLSSKGSLIIPKTIQKALHLKQGDRFQIRVLDGKIILEPVPDQSPIEILYGKYAGSDLLGDLEDEHQRELLGESNIHKFGGSIIA